MTIYCNVYYTAVMLLCIIQLQGGYIPGSFSSQLRNLNYLQKAMCLRTLPLNQITLAPNTVFGV